MTVITFSSIKGGVGKSSTTIQVSNCLAALGKKILVIDLDYNNSVSMYYLTNDTAIQANSKNITKALTSDDYLKTNLNDYTIETERENIKIIPSSLGLIDLRTLSEKRLSHLIPSIKDNYDFVIIDTPPNYDNIVLNAYNASDFIITPVNLTQFDFNTTLTLRDKMTIEVEKADKWVYFVNGFEHRYEDAVSGKQLDYVDLFIENFPNYTDVKTWLPWTPKMKATIDRNMFVAKKEKIPNSEYAPELFKAVLELAKCVIEEEDKSILPEIEYF